MHLWPSTRIRESFKLQYLKKLEWNLNRMNSEKNIQQQQKSPTNSSNQQSLLDDDLAGSGSNSTHKVPLLSNSSARQALSICRDLFMIFSCCYCCFCCGACINEEG